MAKLPWMKFFPNDFSRDMNHHPLEIRGAWITIINHLWSTQERGSATHSIYQWSILLGVAENDCQRILGYIEQENIADCNVHSNGNVTVVSRRIQREEKERENNRLRVARHREQIDCNGNVTPDVTDLSRQCNREKSEVRSQNTEKEKNKAQPPPVDNSEPDIEYEDNRPSAALVEILKEKYPDLNPYEFFQRYQKRFSPKVVIKALLELAKSKTIKKPYAWAEKELPIWNQNYNEREFIENQELVDYGAIVQDLKKLKGGKNE